VIDPAILRTDPDRLRDSQRRRGGSVEVVDSLVAADVAKRDAQLRFDELRNQQKNLGKQIGPLQGALKKASDDAAKSSAQGELDTLMAQAQELAEQVKEADRAAAAATWGIVGGSASAMHIAGAEIGLHQFDLNPFLLQQ